MWSCESIHVVQMWCGNGSCDGKNHEKKNERLIPFMQCSSGTACSGIEIFPPTVERFVPLPQGLRSKKQAWSAFPQIFKALILFRSLLYFFPVGGCIAISNCPCMKTAWLWFIWNTRTFLLKNQNKNGSKLKTRRNYGFAHVLYRTRNCTPFATAAATTQIWICSFIHKHTCTYAA